MGAEAEHYGFTRRPSDYWPSDDIASLAPHLRPDKAETLDLILRQKIYLLQSRRGYRVNTDSHILAYFASNVYKKRTRTPLRVLDLGAGVGLASILFAKAHATSNLHMVELQGQLVSRARRNLELNSLKGCVTRHDLKNGAIPGDLRGCFDVVLMNPPFFQLRRNIKKSKLREKFLARMETSASFSDFLFAASTALDRRNPEAFVAVIHDSRELPRLQEAFAPNQLSVIQAREMIHAPDEPATRILLALEHDQHAREAKSAETNIDSGKSKVPVSLSSPLVLHQTSGVRSEYNDDIQYFLERLPKPVLRIGRLKEH